MAAHRAIDPEAIRLALAELSGRLEPADGFSTDEIGQQLGTAETTTRRILRKLIGGGKMKLSGFRVDRTIAGGTKRVPVYQFVEGA